jgi:pyruvate/2-oxoglutarate dehydrogenase complex dihydrolipoamide dehydrogenase (E3) component
MGLEALGIDTDAALLHTDAWLRTDIPHILAAGDVTGPLQFTHAAGHQGVIAAVNALAGGLPLMRADRAVIPRVTFLDPEIAAAGLTEAEAKAKGIAVDITRHDLAGLDRAVAEGARTGFVKVLTAKGRDRILGVTIVAPPAGEMLAEVLLAMRTGLGLGRILATVHPYPTWSDALKLAAGTWRRGRGNPRAEALLAAIHRLRRGTQA